MKKIIHGLLAVAAAASTQVLEATATNKTFMADRGTLSNNTLMSKAASRACRKGKKDAIGANISATGFVRQSYGDSSLAQYFGTGSVTAPDGHITVTAGTTAATTGVYGYQIDPMTTTTNSMSGIVNLNPRRTEAGAQLEWNQCLSKFVKGLSFSVSAPVVYVRTEMRATYTPEVANATTAKNLSDYFTGGAMGKTTLASGTPVTQVSLANQVITSAYNTATGVADVAVSLGYKFVQEKSYSFGASIHGLIPTGNKSAGLVAFEPKYGNRSFFVGAGLDGRFNLWKSEDKSSALNFNASAKYSYGFSAADVRTLGLFAVGTGAVAAGHYTVAAAQSTNIATPLANLSTLAVNVEPRSRLEAVAGFCYRYNRFTVDAAYNLFYAQAENVTFAGTWSETAQNALTFATPAVYNAVITDASAYGAYILAPSDLAGSYALDLAACTTPAQVIHKAGASVGYKFDTSLPISVRAGGEVDFAANDQSIQTWGAFAQIGFCF